MVYAPGEKPGKETEEVKLQNASKQIVETAILQAVQQVSQDGENEERALNSSGGQQFAEKKKKSSNGRKK
ncbi:A-kinase anchor protein inhibitor 1 [Spea bombifrons]|uniref:A-kinase anchor protein inhibitor 1 n=1 Tax=Spea bombifrons TaxID=233779 RepID=UPI00234A4221|nr:A-kinase anchor protein inhibitor 1 [Spea bombifrons]